MAFVRSPNGEIVEIPDADLASASIVGYTPATPEDVAAAQAAAARKAEFSTVGQQALGAGEALFRGASLNLTDPLEVALGADPERIAARREALGGFGTGLEILGAAGPVLATGLGGAAGAAARLAPTAALSRATAQVGERAATALLGEAAGAAAAGAGRQILRGAVQGGVTELVEGLPYAAGQAVTEATLGDLDLLSEEAAMSVGLGTILGGGLGAAFGAAGGGLGAALRKSQGAADRAIAGFEKWYPDWIAPQVGADAERIRQGLAQRRRFDADPTLKPEDLIGEMIPEVAPVAPYVKAKPPDDAIYVEGPDAPTLPDIPRPTPYEPPATVTIRGREVPNPALVNDPLFAKGMTESLRDMVDSMRSVQSEFDSAFRSRERAALLDGVIDPVAGQNEAIRAVQALNDFIAKGELDGPNSVGAGAIAQAKNSRDAILRNSFGPDDINGVATAPKASEIYDAIEQSVREMKLKRKELANNQGVFGPETRKRLDELNATLTGVTTNESVWGQAAVRQSKINDALHRMIVAETNAMPLIAKKEAVPGAYTNAKRWVVDQKKIADLLGNVGNPNRASDARKVLDWFNAARTFRDEVQATADSIGETFNRESIDAAEAQAREFVSMSREADAIADTGARRAAGSKREQKQWAEWQRTKKAWESQKAKERAAVEEARKSAAAAKMLEFSENEALRKEAIKKAQDDAAVATRERAQTIKDEARAWKASVKWGGLMDVIGANAIGQNPLLAPVFVAYRFGKYLGSPDKTMRVLNELERQSARAKKAFDVMADEFTRGHRVGAVRAGASLAITDAAIDSIVNDPETAMDTLAGATGDLRDFAPETAQRIEGTMISAAQYLASIRPKPSMGPFGTTIPASGAAIAEYESTKAIVEHPLDAYVLASQGRLLPRHVAALEQVWPKLLSQMRISALDALVGVRAEGKTPSFRVLQQASVLFGQDLTQTVATGAANQRAMLEKPQQAQGATARADKITLANRSATTWESSESD